MQVKQFLFFVFIISFFNISCETPRIASAKQNITNNSEFRMNKKDLSAAQKTVYEPDFDYYHKTKDIQKHIQSLTQKCSKDRNLKLEVLHEKDPNLVLVKIKKTSKVEDDKRTKMFILFGQHAREMIAVETGLYFLNVICGLEKEANDVIKNSEIEDALDHYELHMVMIGNPDGREKVEEGHYCWRSNGQKIDPNRNWGFNFKVGDLEDEMFDSSGGDKPFSEAETKTINDHIKKFKPEIFLDVHSGMKGLLYPYASVKAEDLVNHDDNMKKALEITKELLVDTKKNVCPDCLTGSAYEILHYESRGCASDHNFVENQVPVALVWEIWGDNTGLGRMRLQKLEKTLSLFRAQKFNRSKFNRSRMDLSSKAQMEFKWKMLSELKFNQEDENDCFDFFNPVNKKDYDETVKKWSGAIIHVMDQAQSKGIIDLKKKMVSKAMNAHRFLKNPHHIHHKKKNIQDPYGYNYSQNAKKNVETNIYSNQNYLKEAEPIRHNVKSSHYNDQHHHAQIKKALHHKSKYEQQPKFHNEYLPFIENQHHNFDTTQNNHHNSQSPISQREILALSDYYEQQSPVKKKYQKSQ